MSTEEQEFVLLNPSDVQGFSGASLESLPTEKRSGIQKWLEPTDYSGSSSEFGKHRTAHLDGTGAWILQTEQYQQWHGSSDRGALWIKATAGSGKSVIAASLTSKLSTEESAPVLFFFFRHIVSANQKPQSLVRDYMSQVLDHCPGLQHSLNDLVSSRRSLDSVSLDELWRILAAALTRLPRVYCVIDALDEMDGENEGFLHDILALAKRQPESLKMLMTSRPLPQMERVFRDPYVLQVGLQPQLIDPDISTYVQHRLGEFDVSQTLRLRIHETMCSRAQGHFLYARLMMDELLQSTIGSNAREEDLSSALVRLPAPMADMYTQMLIDHSRRSSVPRELQITLLQWVTRSERPLRLLELASMIDFKQNALGMAKDTKSVVREAFGPLLEILEDETVCPIHHSFTEFLYDATRIRGDVNPAEVDAGNATFPLLDYSDAQHAIAQTCVRYLCSGWHQGSPFTETNTRGNDGDEIIRLRLEYPFLDYAAHNWWIHLRKSEECGSSEMIVDLDKFLLRDPKLSYAWARFLMRETKPRGRFGTWTPLHVAADTGIGFYVDHLIRIGYDMEALDRNTHSPLAVAAREGNHEAVKVLLRYGCRNDKDDGQGLKPLHHAASRNHYRTVELLLQSGVDPLYNQNQRPSYTVP